MDTVKKPFADSIPAGFTVLMFFLAVLFANNVFGIEHGTVLIVAVGLGGGIVQATVGIIELKRGEVLKGNVFLAFSAFLFMEMVVGICELTGIIGSSYELAPALGLIFLLLGLVLIASTFIILFTNKILAIFFIGADLFFLLMATFYLTMTPIFAMIGIFLLPLAMVLLVYLVAADIINGTIGKPLVPLGKPFLKMPAPK